MEPNRENELELKNPVLIHDQLNPALWDTDTNMLLPDVREALLNIYNDFLKSNFTDNSVTIPVVDLYLLGSQAGYNYTEHSDIDLHLLVNFELLYETDDVLQLLYQTITRKFNSDLDITVKGIPVELYIQDLKSVNKSTGVYSVFEDKWIQEPGQPPEIDQETLETANEIADELIAATQAVLDNKDTATLAQVEQLINDIYVVRKQSLTEFNEFSAGNLAFKILRNTGMLDDIKQLHKDLRSKELSLAEQNKSQELKEDHCIDCGEQVDHDEKTCPYCGSTDIHRTEDDLTPSPNTVVDGKADDGKRHYQFVTDLGGYVYHDKKGKTVFNLTEKQAKDKARYMNKEAEKKSGRNPGYKPCLVEDKKAEERTTMKCTIKRLTEGTSQKRVSHYKEFDNGHVLHNWKEMSEEEAQEIARLQSIDNPNDIFYVAYDDVMNPDSDIRWVNGESYNYDEVKLQGGKPVIGKKLKEEKELREDVFDYDETSEDDQNLFNLVDQYIANDFCSKFGLDINEVGQFSAYLNIIGDLVKLIKQGRAGHAEAFKGKEKLKEDVNPQETYEGTSAAANLTALVNSEIEAINLYTSVLEVCTCEKTKAVLEEILQDEKDHINLLSNLVDNLVADAFPSDETVEEVLDEKGMNTDVDETAVATVEVVPEGTIDTEAVVPVTALTEDVLDKKNVDELVQDYRENAFGYDDIRDYVETQYPMHKPEVKDELVKLMSKRLAEDIEDPETVPMTALSEDFNDSSTDKFIIDFFKHKASTSLISDSYGMGFEIINGKKYFYIGIAKEDGPVKYVSEVENTFNNDNVDVQDSFIMVDVTSWYNEEPLSEDADSETEEKDKDPEQVTDDLRDEIRSKGFDVSDDNTFSVTSPESGYTATVAVIDNNHFTVVITESNGDVLESLTIADKEELFDYLSLLNIENEETFDNDDDYDED